MTQGTTRKRAAEVAAKRPRKGILTTRELDALAPGEWAAEREEGMRGKGNLVARRMPAGVVRFYFRFTRPDGGRDTLSIGTFDPKGTDGLSLADARDKVRELRAQRDAVGGDLRAAMEAERAEVERQRKAAIAAAEAEATRERATLGALLEAYAAQLAKLGKASARAVETSFVRNVREPWAELWNKEVAAVTVDDLLDVVARLHDAGKAREAAKVRSYLRAAFAAGIAARRSATALPALRRLAVTANPARDLSTIPNASQPRDRALTLAELRAYWRRIAELPDPAGAMLRFHLLTGGQRLEQLARVTVKDIDPDAEAIILRDPKGRRKAPRPHPVPLLPEAKAAMAAMQGGTLGPFVFTLNGGESGATNSSVRDHVGRIVEAMEAADELTGGKFTASDLRRTVETRLSAEGVSAEVRAHLQSHGLGGVQARHYDRHSYLPEKRAALETLHRLLTGTAASVTPIGRKARAK